MCHLQAPKSTSDSRSRGREMKRTSWLVILAGLSMLALGAAGCGDDESTTYAGPSADAGSDSTGGGGTGGAGAGGAGTGGGGTGGAGTGGAGTGGGDAGPGICETQGPICEAPAGYHCWYVAPSGDDTNDGSFDAPFATLQHAVDTMNGGDVVYLREGTYQENVQIPKEKNGTCIDRDCSEGSWSTIKSYPCEWAVLDGGHRDTHVLGRWHSGSGSGTLPDGSFDVLPDGTWGELPSGTWGGLADIHFWKVEHLEITGGCQTSGGAGWAASGGPFWIRYVYFHDNRAQSRDANPGAIRGYTWHDSIVEHCVFINNGCDIDDGNCADINIFSDYADSRQNWTRDDWEANGVHTITYATRNNEYRYNYFEGTPVGIKHKNDQILAARVGDDLQYSTLGDRIHHNIFKSNSYASIVTNQDFTQVHHNVLTDSRLSNNEYHGLDMIRLVTYNNMVIRNKIHYHVPYYGPAESSWSEIVINFKPRYAAMNNIVEDFTKEWDSASISLGVGMDKDDSGVATVDLSDAIVDRNYIYQPRDPEHFRIGRHAGSCSDWLTTDQMNSCYATQNYSQPLNSSDLLHPGTTDIDTLKTRLDHAVSAGVTIASGGLGGAHPYLPGVTIPSYVGPCPDDACTWIDDVVGLTDVSPMMQR